MSSTEVAARVRQLVGEMVPSGPREVGTADRLIEDLGYNSVTMIELALVLEVEFDLQDMAGEEAMDLVTVGDIETTIARLATAG
ncbi:phosphopantetheine-binding protein [Kitasatospora sp. NPDC097643]|uniref:acyl carrier protein n=1 Tax=Kitasatospora sp. NPDC097643 TaxID=3157230 RepID=UPI00332D90E9